MTAATELGVAIRHALLEGGDPERAAGQQRYMKSALPYRGYRAPELAALLRPRLQQHRLADRGEWEGLVRDLWDEAEHREEWYAAIALLRHRYYREWIDPDLLPLLRHLIEAGAWWDVVDEISAHLVGAVLAGSRGQVTPTIRAWSSAPHLWVRRSAIIAQLRHGPQTDTGLLAEAILGNDVDSRFGSDFFIRKANGWALRQYARTDPGWVLEFLDSHHDRLAPLTRREASKHLG